MAQDFRKRRRLHIPITLSVALISLNVALMVCWIVLLAQLNSWSALTIGTVFFTLMLVGLTIYFVLTIKEFRLNQRQTNFVDSITHELKTPIASLRLYLETLQMRALAEEQRGRFYHVMGEELGRLDHLINQLLEVARLDAIGYRAEAEDISLQSVLTSCAEAACLRHKCNSNEVFSFDVQPSVVHAPRIVLEMIFGNLFDNAVKYAGQRPQVDVHVRVNGKGRVVAQVGDNGDGVPREMRKAIFRMFHRGGNELQRKQTGTGLGLYIVRTLVHLLKGRIGVEDREAGPGSLFIVELPGRSESCES